MSASVKASQRTCCVSAALAPVARDSYIACLNKQYVRTQRLCNDARLVRATIENDDDPHLLAAKRGVPSRLYHRKYARANATDFVVGRNDDANHGFSVFLLGGSVQLRCPLNPAHA